MRKIKLDDFDVRVLINGLYQTLDDYCAEEKNQVCDFTLSLIDTCEKMKPGRKQRFLFEPAQKRILYRSLVSWRNQRIAAGEITDPIDELLIKIAA